MSVNLDHIATVAYKLTDTQKRVLRTFRSEGRRAVLRTREATWAVLERKGLITCSINGRAMSPLAQHVADLLIHEEAERQEAANRTRDLLVQIGLDSDRDVKERNYVDLTTAWDLAHAEQAEVTSATVVKGHARKITAANTRQQGMFTIADGYTSRCGCGEYLGSHGTKASAARAHTEHKAAVVAGTFVSAAERAEDPAVVAEREAKMAKWQAEEDKRNEAFARLIERQQARKAEAEKAPESPAPVATEAGRIAEAEAAGRSFYVSVRDTARPEKFGLLAGPFPTEHGAREYVESARQEAQRVNRDAYWHAYGTCSMPGDYRKPGSLNAALGLPV